MVKSKLTLWEKFEIILSSPRFWQLVFIGILEALKQMEVIDGAVAQAIANGLQIIFGGSVLVGSADSIAEKSAGKK